MLYYRNSGIIKTTKEKGTPNGARENTMKKVTIEYKTGRKREFTTDQVFYKTQWGWLYEIGYYQEGAKRKTWLPIGGKRDENNDYSGIKVTITEV